VNSLKLRKTKDGVETYLDDVLLENIVSLSTEIFADGIAEISVKMRVIFPTEASEKK
jgi:hypothetical protein